MEITLLPRITAVHVEADTPVLFITDGAEAKISVSLEPVSAPLDGLSWTLSPKNIAEMETHEDGTAVLRPLKAGKAVVSVKESGGKQGKATIEIKQPVTEMVLKAPSSVVLPGKTITLKAECEPKNATDKTLTWSVDVDESLASITPRGQLKIQKDAPAGTVITVTCAANGAAEPVSVSMQMTVGEK